MRDERIDRRNFIAKTGATAAGAAMLLSQAAEAQYGSVPKREQPVEAPLEGVEVEGVVPREAAAVALPMPGTEVTGGWAMHQGEGEASALVEKHVPDIQVEGMSIRVKCRHPSNADHFISSIRIEVGARELATAAFLPEITSPEAVFTVLEPGTYPVNVISFCNLHGVYHRMQMVEFKA